MQHYQAAGRGVCFIPQREWTNELRGWTGSGIGFELQVLARGSSFPALVNLTSWHQVLLHRTWASYCVPSCSTFSSKGCPVSKTDLRKPPIIHIR